MGSPARGKVVAIACALIELVKLNSLNLQACFADVLHRIPEHPSHRVDKLLPWRNM